METHQFPGVARAALLIAKLLAEETIISEGGGHTFPDQRLDIAVGNRDDILKITLGFDHQRIAPVEIVERYRAGLLGKGPGESKARVEFRLLRSHASGS